jgi:hypothetical protein
LELAFREQLVGPMRVDSRDALAVSARSNMREDARRVAAVVSAWSEEPCATRSGERVGSACVHQRRFA